MALITTIDRKFLGQKLKELKKAGCTHEYKPTNNFWADRIFNQKYPCGFTYVCRRRVVKLRATDYTIIDTPTDNGIPEVVKTPKCFAIRLECSHGNAKLERW